jgi:hypothetical protein
MASSTGARVRSFSQLYVQMRRQTARNGLMYEPRRKLHLLTQIFIYSVVTHMSCQRLLSTPILA